MKQARFMFLTFFFVATMLGELYSQTPIPDCLQQFSSEFIEEEFNREHRPYDFDMHARGAYRLYGTSMQVILDESYYDSIYKLSKESFFEFFRAMFVRNIAPYIIGDMDKIRNLREISFVFETNCTISYPCYFKIKQNAYVLCNEDPEFEPSSILTRYNGENYYKEIVPINCGVKCCERVYQVSYNNEFGNFDITGFLVRDVEGSQCIEVIQSDCLTGEPIQCTSECK